MAKRRPGPYFVVAQGYHAHPKVLAAGKDGRAFHLAALDWCTTNRTDGVLALGAIPLVHAMAGTRKPAQVAAVAAGLIDPEPGHLRVHDFLHWQSTAEEIEATSKRRAASGRSGGQAKPKQLAKQNGSNLLSKTQAKRKQNASKLPSKNEAEVRSKNLEALCIANAIPSAGSAPADERAHEGPFGETLESSEFVMAYLAEKEAAGVNIDLIAYSTWGEIDAGCKDLLAKGADRDQLLDAVRRNARNPKASPRRLDIELVRGQQAPEPPPLNAAGRRVAERSAYLARFDQPALTVVEHRP